MSPSFGWSPENTSAGTYKHRSYAYYPYSLPLAVKTVAADNPLAMALASAPASASAADTSAVSATWAAQAAASVFKTPSVAGASSPAAADIAAAAGLAHDSYRALAGPVAPPGSATSFCGLLCSIHSFCCCVLP